MKSFLQPIQHRFLALTLRDQKLVIILSVLFAVMLLWIAVWQPVDRARTDAAASYQENLEVLAWMQENTVKVNPAKVIENTANSGSLLSTVTDTATLYQIVISHAEPSEDGTLHLSLENVAFDHLLSWLEILQRDHSVKASQITINRSMSAPGVVSASLVLQAE